MRIFTERIIVMIDIKELKKKDRCEIAYLYLISYICLYRLKIEKISLYRKHNAKDRLISNIIVYVSDPSETLRHLYFRLFDADYVFFLNYIAQDFPELPIEDLTDEADKIKVPEKKGGEVCQEK